MAGRHRLPEAAPPHVSRGVWNSALHPRAVTGEFARKVMKVGPRVRESSPARMPRVKASGVQIPPRVGYERVYRPVDAGVSAQAARQRKFASTDRLTALKRGEAVLRPLSPANVDRYGKAFPPEVAAREMRGRIGAPSRRGAPGSPTNTSDPVRAAARAARTAGKVAIAGRRSRTVR